MSAPLLTLTDSGLHCPSGGFYVDPWLPVSHALITHAHADHARAGSGLYHTARSGQALLRKRLGEGAQIRALAYGEELKLGGVTVSLHPAGHVLG